MATTSSSGSSSSSTSGSHLSGSLPISTRIRVPLDSEAPKEDNKESLILIDPTKISQNDLNSFIDKNQMDKALLVKTHYHESKSRNFNAVDHDDIKSALIKSSIQLFSYIGFNPVGCRLRVEMHEKDRTRFLDDLTEIATLILTRGTRFDKIFKNSIAEARERGQDLTQKYGFKKRAKSPSDISLSRFTHAFPDICSIVLNSEHNVRVLGLVPNGYPKSLCFPGAPALFPAIHRDTLMAHYITWNQSFSAVIRSNQDVETIKRFAEISYNSPIFSNDTRLEFYSKITL